MNIILLQTEKGIVELSTVWYRRTTKAKSDTGCEYRERKLRCFFYSNYRYVDVFKANFYPPVHWCMRAQFEEMICFYLYDMCKKKKDIIIFANAREQVFSLSQSSSNSLFCWAANHLVLWRGLKIKTNFRSKWVGYTRRSFLGEKKRKKSKIFLFINLMDKVRI